MASANFGRLSRKPGSAKCLGITASPLDDWAGRRCDLALRHEEKRYVAFTAAPGAALRRGAGGTASGSGLSGDRLWRGADRLAAFARSYPDPDLAGSAAQCTASPWARNPYAGGRDERDPADDDGLRRNGEEHRRRGRRYARRRLPDARHRPRRDRDLRLADIQRHHLRLAEISRPE